MFLIRIELSNAVTTLLVNPLEFHVDFTFSHKKCRIILTLVWYLNTVFASCDVRSR